ncbi:MAG: 4-(cytidine 5'-diphospho)-2-C-methyl-D-erythritol kinase [Gammaproteobacteria bacterium]|nr:4-(cytidine 5'-diphospho)-2-C-methyl-D-erythritol kinase [Gammaproteobacteria bacterium]
MKLLSPAKVNLFLRILGKREDGFHELETLMCPVDCCDEITLEAVESGIELTIEGADLPTGPENLAYQAAAAVQEKAGITNGVRIHIDKKIPLGGGLAGGSSNAAIILKGCNELWNAGLTQAELHELAAGMGSDVNLFLEEGPCLCRGRGELVEPVDWDEELEIILLNPGFGIETPATFKAYAALPEASKRGADGDWQSSYKSPAGEVVNFQLRNDLEPAVFEKHLWMREAKLWLQEQEESLDALMSGSGATLFTLTRDEETAISLEKKMKKTFGPEAMVLRVRPLKTSHA